MTNKDALRMTMDTGQLLCNTYLGDLSDADLLVRAMPGMNHVAYQLGHLIGSEHYFMTALGHRMPELPSGFAEAYSKESATSDDAKRFLPKARYLELRDKVRAGTLAALAATSDATLDSPAPEEMRSYCPTIGAVFNLIGMHDAMHAGQWIAVRRKLGKPIVM